ncbi:hypothetical protein [Streptomyces sp. NBC_01351]|uniref:hypothetical protein n=1 Tax=Streptomyces sp. NBC_01351 TaxID=2903833 RepID=UPI002E32DAFA|nr:hypothetical protein [Streptomyces sp. NBC_01351]
MTPYLLQGRAHRGGDLDLRLQQLVLDLALVRDRSQAGRGTYFLHERSGKERVRVDQQVLLLDPKSDHGVRLTPEAWA